MKKIDNNLKLIYVHKIGINSKNEGLYEFIFSKDPTNIDIEGWQWDLSPACDNAEPPEADRVDLILNLKTDKFDLFCLHEAVDREYMHGYHLIHALAYEIESNGDDESFGENEYDEGWDIIGDSSEINEIPLLVFHYGVSVQDVVDKFYERDIVLQNNEFIEGKNINV
jgi:hypothetical protein